MSQDYFQKNTFKPEIPASIPTDLGIVVVIPSFNEPNLAASLNSILSCEKPKCSVEVIVVVNYPNGSSIEVERNALDCIGIIETLNASKHPIPIYAVKAFNLPVKHAGVGLARKIGMDQAAWRLFESNNPHKIIACFDADATCLPNYLVELEKLWKKNPKTNACSIRYEHPIQGSEYDNSIYQGIAQYELHLRYYVQACRYIGHPFSFHTIGSSMACSAKAYTRFGGMNRNKAGEDFYFLQKIIPHGEFRELNSTSIYPSPRPSYRVPFGTGRAMTKYLANDCPDYLTYNLQSFLDLKKLIENGPSKLFNVKSEEVARFWNEQPNSIKAFISENEFIEAIEEINANASTNTTFLKRFFLWFNAFKVLKFLNFANENFFQKHPVKFAANELLTLLNREVNYPVTNNKLLQIYRDLDYNNL